MVEVDRSTMAIERLAAKFTAYRELFRTKVRDNDPALADGEPADRTVYWWRRTWPGPSRAGYPPVALAVTDAGPVALANRRQESTWEYGPHSQWTRRPGGRCHPCHQKHEERREKAAAQARGRLEKAREANAALRPVLDLAGLRRRAGGLPRSARARVVCGPTVGQGVQAQGAA
ncbi:hypothetical protein [Streptomyces sp. CB01881]|uniref:hypothetical protein n=1 Tax=Streptomyces sp. CB01881 TaxID=2078691 RepID=UPI0011E00B71|nr:hypothetical protein [Streptomyces sp. CB01881]TYC68804.1 hypothetical protein EH183_38810 [Streptomyces sp. CB01881]